VLQGHIRDLVRAKIGEMINWFIGNLLIGTEGWYIIASTLSANNFAEYNLEKMIARIWHGRTSLKNYEPYTEFLKKVAIPDYRKIEGFQGLSFLRNIMNEEGNFYLITYWISIEAIKGFAGHDFEKPKYYPEDKKYLLEFEERVSHYEVFA
jgi:heme-degrading monooxygenase HmoA